MTLAWKMVASDHDGRKLLRFSRNAAPGSRNCHAAGRDQDVAMTKLIQAAREASPYLLVELILPGGTLIAILLWLYRNRSR